MVIINKQNAFWILDSTLIMNYGLQGNNFGQCNAMILDKEPKTLASTVILLLQPFLSYFLIMRNKINHIDFWIGLANKVSIFVQS